MKTLGCMLVFMAVTLCACGMKLTTTPTATATETATITTTPSPLPTETPTLSPTPSYPVDGFGPANFPADVDPLTGLKTADPTLLQRRPMLIKVSNLPRNVRPQWGLSLADIIFEYDNGGGTTRFSAIYYGRDASMVGPIRSGHFIDADLVSGYQAVFALGSAYAPIMQRFNASDFADRLVIEEPGTPLTRYDPKGNDYEMVNTADLSAYATNKGINGIQNLDSMFFKLGAPAGGQPGSQVYIHYSGTIYNRWDYDTTNGIYLRFSDSVVATNGVAGEQYVQLTDRLTNQPIGFDNVVILYVNHKLYAPDIYDILLSGSGEAVAFRDGQAYKVQWQRKDTGVVSLTAPDGSPFPFKPGNTWFEVIGLQSTLAQTGRSWRFMHVLP